MFPTRIKMTGTSATITPERDLASLGTPRGPAANATGATLGTLAGVTAIRPRH